MKPVLFLRVQQPLDLPGSPLRLVLLLLQRGPPGLPLPLLLQQLVVQGLQLQDLLLQHGARGLQRLQVLAGGQSKHFNQPQKRSHVISEEEKYFGPFIFLQKRADGHLGDFSIKITQMKSKRAPITVSRDESKVATAACDATQMQMGKFRKTAAILDVLSVVSNSS